MLVFLSYATQDRPVAEEIELALRGAGHTVFFDRASLPPGGEFNVRIKEAIRECDALVFLVSANSIARGSYARTELKFARERWEHPRERVLPVLVQKVPWEDIPIYLKSVTVLEPEGNTAAEVVSALEGFTPQAAPAALPPLRPGEISVVLGAPSLLHNVPVAAPQGVAVGMQISVPVEVRGAAGKALQLVVRFARLGGPALFTNQSELVYRDQAGNVATGTQPRPIDSAQVSFVESAIAIPYFALNFMPTNGLSVHELVMTAEAYIDQRSVAQSVPVPFTLRY